MASWLPHLPRVRVIIGTITPAKPTFEASIGPDTLFSIIGEGIKSIIHVEGGMKIKYYDKLTKVGLTKLLKGDRMKVTTPYEIEMLGPRVERQDKMPGKPGVVIDHRCLTRFELWTEAPKLATGWTKFHEAVDLSSPCF